MPLLAGKENIGRNIQEMEKNHPHKQAVAAALNEARESGAKLAAGADQSSHVRLDAIIGKLSKRCKSPQRMSCGSDHGIMKMSRYEPHQPRLNVKWRYDHEPVPAYANSYTSPPAEQGVALRRRGAVVRFAQGLGSDGPNEAVRGDAADYVKKYGPVFGINPKLAPSVRRELDENLSRRTADAFDAMQHDPQNPEVKAAYEQFKREILAQYEHAIGRGGIKFSPWMQEGQPYRNSADMRRDVRDLHHLWFFPTVSPTQEKSFGDTGGDLDPAVNPLVERTGHTIDGYKMTVNDALRAVHDFFGHAAEGNEFGPAGEFNAWMAHARMFSPLAMKALTTETSGQNSTVNFGSHLRRQDGSLPKPGEPDYIHPRDRPFAEQKIGILPDDILEDHMNRLHERPSEKMSKMLDSLTYRA